MIAVAVVSGFVVLGKEFISIWIGQQYIDAYYIILLLIIPVTVPLVENTAISILDATLKRLFRSIVLVIMAMINVIVSVILIKQFSFWGAAMGTFISLCVGHIFLMNWYYARTFKMNIMRMFTSIFRGILPMGILAGIVCVPLTAWGEYGVMNFIIKGVEFVVIYCILLWKWGLHQDEKNYIKNTLHIGKQK